MITLVDEVELHRVHRGDADVVVLVAVDVLLGGDGEAEGVRRLHRDIFVNENIWETFL